METFWRIKLDEMTIKEKIFFNPRTNEIIGLEEGACNTDAIVTELEIVLSNYSSDGTPSNNDNDDASRKKPSVAKHILLFMFILWDRENNPMKRVVARFSIGKSSGEELCNKIRFVICALVSRGFIVNQMTCDGATENVSAMKQIATIKASDTFANLDQQLP